MSEAWWVLPLVVALLGICVGAIAQGSGRSRGVPPGTRLVTTTPPPIPGRKQKRRSPLPPNEEALAQELGLLRLIAGAANTLPREHRSPRLEALLTRWRRLAPQPARDAYRQTCTKTIRELQDG